MKTKATDQLPEIEWERTNELLDKDIDEREEYYLMTGFDDKGKEYKGTGEYSCGELIKIDDITQVCHYPDLKPILNS
jgi:hypothetical protein